MIDKPQFNFVFQISQSSILNSLLMVSLLVMFLWWVLSKERNYKYFRTDFIGVIVILIAIRLFFPFEFFYTWSFFSRRYGDLHYYVLTAPFFNTGLEVKDVFVIVWILGSIVQLIRYGCEIYRTRYMEKYVLVAENEQLKKAQIIQDYKIVRSDRVRQPEVRSFTKTIYLPKVDFSDEELKYILLHEKQHLKNHDLFLLQVINLLQIIYWWFPLIYVFRKQFQFLLEIRVDHQVSDILEQNEYLDYAQAMVSVNKKIQMERPKYSQNLGFADFGKSELSHRVAFYLEGENKKRTSRFLLALLLIVGIGSSALIVEPNTGVSRFGECYNDFVTSSNSYLLEKKDGTYEWYKNEELFQIIDQENQIQAVKDGKLGPIPIREE